MLNVNITYKKLGYFRLKDICFELPAGYIMGLIGENGAGKTSIINMILGLTKADMGEVRLFGKTYEEDEVTIRDNIGIVLQERLYEDSWTLLENAARYGRYYSQYDEKRFVGLLTEFGLSERKKYKELSKGEELKFQFAFAMSHNPKLLVLDEATGNFDLEFREKFLGMLKGFISDGEHSVLMATHLTEDLDRLADYITYVDEGDQLFSMDIETLHDTYRIAMAEAYKIRLLPKEDVMYMETGEYTTRALIRYYARRPYDKALTLTVPTIEELMYFISKGMKAAGVK